MNITFASKRDKAFELVDEGLVSPVEDMLDANELSDRFIGGDNE